MASNESYGMNGCFAIPYSKKVQLNVIVSDQLGWDHVSVHVHKKNRTPTWAEMNFIKDLFFKEYETVIQFHPPKSVYINDHPNVLHLWRRQRHEYELPPVFMV